MKGTKGNSSNQGDRQPVNSSQQNRLHRTQQPPQQKPEYLQNSYQVLKKTTVTEKTIPSEKPAFTMPPRAGSNQKLNYKVQDNMTHSKIQEAKQGLQLLKKKMSRNGMSRDKNERGSIEKRQQEVYNPKKAVTKQEQYYGYEKEQKKSTPQANQKIPEKTPPIPTKSVSGEERGVRKQPPPQKSEYINPTEEAPLKSNQDFMAILERQMAKENSKNQSQPAQKGMKKTSSYEQAENEEIELVECSKGCGRQFNIKIIEKHEKVCEKVFQSKRKVFNSAAFRQAQGEGDFKQPPPPPPQIREEKPKKTAKGKQEKLPKWKLQSAAFRAGIKQGRGEQLTSEEKAVAEKASGMVQCGSCGRKFNEDVAKRHIPFCQSKSKQMPKMNTSKRK